MMKPTHLEAIDTDTEMVFDKGSKLRYPSVFIKLISVCLLSLQRAPFASLRSLQTSRWCWGRGWCCPAWSSTIAALFSGPRMAWPSASARVCEVSTKWIHREVFYREEGEKKKVLCVSSRCRRQCEVERAIKSATVLGSVLTVKALTKAFPCLQKCRGRFNIKGLSREVCEWQSGQKWVLYIMLN